MMKTRLYRSDTYPYKLHEEVELQKYIDTDSGMFLLTVLNEEGDFELQIPTEQEGKYDSILDTFDGFQDRQALYYKTLLMQRCLQILPGYYGRNPKP